MDDIVLQQSNEYELLVENVYNNVIKTVNADKFGISELIELLPLLIDNIESIKKLGGLNKKAVCIMTLRKIVERVIRNDDEKKTLLTFVNEHASKMIDMIVFVANGKMILSKTSKYSKKFFNLMKCCQC
jgi:hypothetical protein